MNEFGERLKQCRESRGMSQFDLSCKAKVLHSSISQWESGKSMPSANKLVLLSAALSVSIDYLLTGKLPTPA